MLGIVLIAVTFIVAALVHLFFTRKVNFFSASILSKFLAASFIFIGILLTIWQQSLISEALIYRKWPTARATVIATGITGERASNPAISCRYRVNGTDYLLTTDMETPAFGRKRSRRQTAEIIISQYPVGSEVLVHYNPDQPDQAHLRTGPFWNNYLILMTALILLGIGFLGLINRPGKTKNHSG